MAQQGFLLGIVHQAVNTARGWVLIGGAVCDLGQSLGWCDADTNGDASLNAPMRVDGEGEWQDWLVDDSASQENIMVEREESDNRLGVLNQALTVLNDRERHIFKSRRLVDEPVTLEELSEQFNISRERVRQIEVRAFEKVQAAVKSGMARLEAPPVPALLEAR